MNEYDIIIIGSGPAGLEAAITATIRKKNILIMGSSDLSKKLSGAHTINNYLGFPSVSGSNLAKAFKKHLDSFNIKITPKKASMIYNMGDFFAVQSGQDMYQSPTVILATGVIAAKLFPGEEKLLGKGVSYCATCDAALYPGKTAIVISYSPNEEREAEFLAEYAKKVIYVPMYGNVSIKKDNIEIRHATPTAIEGESAFTSLITDKGIITADGVFILRENISPSSLIPGIELDGAHIKVGRDMSTSISGIYACGDVTGLPYQYIKAAGEGNIAALSACTYIDKNKS